MSAMNSTASHSAENKFAATLKIRVAEDKRYSFIEVCEALRNSLTDSQFQQIKRVNQHDSNRSWYVKFDNKFDISSLVNAKISIKGDELSLLDPSDDKHYTAVLRFHWLPSNCTLNELTSLLRNKVKIVEFINAKMETSQVAGFEHIETGVGRIKVKVLKENREQVDNILGRQRLVNGSRVFVTRAGDGLVCLHCNQPGHMRKNCEKYAEFITKKCSSCNKLGHLDTECNMAHKIGSKNEEDPDLDDDLVEKSTDNKDKQNETNFLSLGSANKYNERRPVQVDKSGGSSSLDQTIVNSTGTKRINPENSPIYIDDNDEVNMSLQQTTQSAPAEKKQHKSLSHNNLIVNPENSPDNITTNSLNKTFSKNNINNPKTSINNSNTKTRPQTTSTIKKK